MPATQNFVLAKGYDAGGAITKKRFVKFSADQTVVQCTVAGEGAIGVSLFSVSAAEVAKGKGASVMIEGRVVVEAGSALAVGDRVTTNASGQAIVAAAGNRILGVVDEPAAAITNECSVHLAISGAVA